MIWYDFCFCLMCLSRDLKGFFRLRVVPEESVHLVKYVNCSEPRRAVRSTPGVDTNHSQSRMPSNASDSCYVQFYNGWERILMVSRKGKIIGVLKRSFIALEHCNQLTFVVQVLVLRASQKNPQKNKNNAGLRG